MTQTPNMCPHRLQCLARLQDSQVANTFVCKCCKVLSHLFARFSMNTGSVGQWPYKLVPGNFEWCSTDDLDTDSLNWKLRLCNLKEMFVHPCRETNLGFILRKLNFGCWSWRLTPQNIRCGKGSRVLFAVVAIGGHRFSNFLSHFEPEQSSVLKLWLPSAFGASDSLFTSSGPGIKLITDFWIEVARVWKRARHHDFQPRAPGDLRHVSCMDICGSWHAKVCTTSC